MLSVRISYNAKSRVLDLVSVSNGDETLPIGTTNDDLETRLELEFVDPDGTYSTYGRWCDFGVLIPNETKTRYLHPRMRFKEDNTLDIPYGIIHYAKTGVLPIQLTLISETTELSSVNSVRLKVTQAIEAEDVSIVIPDQVNVMNAVETIDFIVDTDTGAQCLLTKLGGVKEPILLEDHYRNSRFGKEIVSELAEKTDKLQAIPQWNPETAFEIGSTVIHDGQMYISNISDNLGNIPSPHTNEFWKITGGLPAKVEVIGDGYQRTFEIVHGYGTYFVFAQVMTNDSLHRLVYADIRAESTNSIRVSFNEIPEPGSMVVFVKPAI